MQLQKLQPGESGGDQELDLQVIGTLCLNQLFMRRMSVQNPSIKLATKSSQGLLSGLDVAVYRDSRISLHEKILKNRLLLENGGIQLLPTLWIRNTNPHYLLKCLRFRAIAMSTEILLQNGKELMQDDPQFQRLHIFLEDTSSRTCHTRPLVMDLLHSRAKQFMPTK
jgi:hypothetical protein